MRKSCRVFHDRLILRICFRGSVLFVLECSSAVWCSSADPTSPVHKTRQSNTIEYLKLMDRVATGARFLTGGVFGCDIEHRRSVAVLCILYKIRCKSLHPYYGAQPVPYVPVRFTRGASVAHRYTYALTRCRTSLYCRTFIPFSLSL